MQIASQADKYEFYHIPMVCPELNGGRTEEGISIHRQFDNSPVHYESSINVPDIAGWIEEESWPQLIEFSQDSYDIIFGNGRKNAIILFTNDLGHDFIDVFEETSFRKRGILMFVISGTEEGVQSAMAQFFGVTKDTAPAMFIVNPMNDLARYKFQGSIMDITIEQIQKFCNDFE